MGDQQPAHEEPHHEDHAAQPGRLGEAAGGGSTGDHGRHHQQRQHEQGAGADQGCGGEPRSHRRGLLARFGEHAVLERASGGGTSRHDATEGVGRQLRGGHGEPSLRAQRQPLEPPDAHEAGELQRQHRHEPERIERQQVGPGLQHGQQARPQDVERDRRDDEEREPQEDLAAVGLDLGPQLPFDRWSRLRLVRRAVRRSEGPDVGVAVPVRSWGGRSRPDRRLAGDQPGVLLVDQRVALARLSRQTRRDPAPGSRPVAWRRVPCPGVRRAPRSPMPAGRAGCARGTRASGARRRWRPGRWSGAAIARGAPSPNGPPRRRRSARCGSASRAGRPRSRRRAAGSAGARAGRRTRPPAGAVHPSGSRRARSGCGRRRAPGTFPPCPRARS